MKDHELNARIVRAGKAFFDAIRGEPPSLFDKGRWIGKVLDRCMESEELKTRMFRFVDVFPCLNTPDQLSCHLKEYFGREAHEVPSVLKWGARSADFGGAIGVALLSKAIRQSAALYGPQGGVGGIPCVAASPRKRRNSVNNQGRPARPPDVLWKFDSRGYNSAFLPAGVVSYFKADDPGIGGRRHGGNGSDVVRRESCRPEAYNNSRVPTSRQGGWQTPYGRKAQRRAAGHPLAKQVGGGISEHAAGRPKTSDTQLVFER